MATETPPGMWRLTWVEKEDWGRVGDAREVVGHGTQWERKAGWQWSRGEEWGRHKQVAWGGKGRARSASARGGCGAVCWAHLGSLGISSLQ